MGDATRRSAADIGEGILRNGVKVLGGIFILFCAVVAVIVAILVITRPQTGDGSTDAPTTPSAPRTVTAS